MSLLCTLVGLCPESWLGTCPVWLFGITNHWYTFIIGVAIGAIIARALK